MLTGEAGSSGAIMATCIPAIAGGQKRRASRPLSLAKAKHNQTDADGPSPAESHVGEHSSIACLLIMFFLNRGNDPRNRPISWASNAGRRRRLQKHVRQRFSATHGQLPGCVPSSFRFRRCPAFSAETVRAQPLSPPFAIAAENVK